MKSGQFDPTSKFEAGVANARSLAGRLQSSLNQEDSRFLARCGVEWEKVPEHDPENGYRFSDNIMLKQKDRAG